MTIVPQESDFENDTVTIPVDEYLHLLNEVKFLRYLEHIGVDNWEGYQEAIKVWRDGA